MPAQDVHFVIIEAELAALIFDIRPKYREVMEKPIIQYFDSKRMKTDPSWYDKIVIIVLNSRSIGRSSGWHTSESLLQQSSQFQRIIGTNEYQRLIGREV